MDGEGDEGKKKSFLFLSFRIFFSLFGFQSERREIWGIVWI